MLASLGYANCPYFIGAPLAAITSVAGSFGTTLSGYHRFRRRHLGACSKHNCHP
ncbi:MAG: hypothetical protein ACOX2E_02105 [Syntrophaceticus sp.]